MNDYIANIGIQLAKKFVHDSSAMADQSLETLYRVTPTRSQIALSENQVKLRLTGIKQKTGGPDKITSREMAEAAETLFEDLSLQHFQKNSIPCAIYPSKWKIGEVVSVFKKGTKSDCANYRPPTMLKRLSA